MAKRVHIKWYGNQYTRGLYARIDKKELKMGNKIVEAAKRNAPVRTGALRKSIQLIKTKIMGYRVRTGVPYARFVEYGTSRMSAQPYMRPALKQVRGLS